MHALAALFDADGAGVKLPLLFAALTLPLSDAAALARLRAACVEQAAAVAAAAAAGPATPRSAAARAPPTVLWSAALAAAVERAGAGAIDRATGAACVSPASAYAILTAAPVAVRVDRDTVEDAVMGLLPQQGEGSGGELVPVADLVDVLRPVPPDAALAWGKLQRLFAGEQQRGQGGAEALRRRWADAVHVRGRRGRGSSGAELHVMRCLATPRSPRRPPSTRAEAAAAASRRVPRAPPSSTSCGAWACSCPRQQQRASRTAPSSWGAAAAAAPAQQRRGPRRSFTPLRLPLPPWHTCLDKRRRSSSSSSMGFLPCSSSGGSSRSSSSLLSHSSSKLRRGPLPADLAVCPPIASSSLSSRRRQTAWT